MNIGIVADVRNPIEKNAFGYSYRVFKLAEGLKKRGHDVSLFAGEGSSFSGNVFISSGHYYNPLLENVLNAYKKSSVFDVLNMQLDHYAAEYDSLAKCPVLRTVTYGAHKNFELEKLKKSRNCKYIANSKRLTETYPFLNWQAVIYGGLDVNEFPFNPKPSDYLVTISRVMPEKGIHVAIDIAKKSGKKLYIAGGKFDENYFKEKIESQLGENIEYVGELKFADKVSLVGNALATIFTPTEEEGFGNVIIESLAVGTPVLTWNKGASGEIVSHGKTGFIGSDPDEIAEFVPKLNKIKRSDCRDHVAQNFTIERMVNAYEKLFMENIV